MYAISKRTNQSIYETGMHMKAQIYIHVEHIDIIYFYRNDLFVMLLHEKYKYFYKYSLSTCSLLSYLMTVLCICLRKVLLYIILYILVFIYLFVSLKHCYESGLFAFARQFSTCRSFK